MGSHEAAWVGARRLLALAWCMAGLYGAPPAHAGPTAGEQNAPLLVQHPLEAPQRKDTVPRNIASRKPVASADKLGVANADEPPGAQEHPKPEAPGVVNPVRGPGRYPRGFALASAMLEVMVLVVAILYGLRAIRSRD